MKLIHIISLMICLSILVLPVSAKYTKTSEPKFLLSDQHFMSDVSNLTVDVAPDGKAIERISVEINTNTTVNFTLWYGSGSTVSGWMRYDNDGFYSQYTEVALGPSISGYSYWGLQEMGRIDIVAYARNETDSGLVSQTGFVVYDDNFGLSETRTVAFYPVADLSDNIIYKFQIISSRPVYVEWFTNDRATVAGETSKSILDVISDYVTFAISLTTFLYDMVVSLFSWLKFFFWDNLGMTIALYLTLTMAFAARAAKGNMAKFLRTWFKDQIGLFNFIIALWKSLIDIISSFRGIFRI